MRREGENLREGGSEQTTGADLAGNRPTTTFGSSENRDAWKLSVVKVCAACRSVENNPHTHTVRQSVALPLSALASSIASIAAVTCDFSVLFPRPLALYIRPPAPPKLRNGE
ncbi:hypothetical protein PF010_g8885 [Phytophthora fragariae]|uniref:Uncharacterized protein n=1 Tax=Phytophthora fragariae TaxID=53985 RepID=A0A6A3ZK77_9STRA|nr:hypothetical protein PF009_g10484 [Phytophthora fragariae]KAE9013452.1 hypothetical protein PF011_g8481 [Phytophthora fragariae]KAE9116659.1 hypothetical protein PF010_g8885 [Phytophthora fragariae]KAE9238159.1 hypothetical protein PF002_g10721 [Phytophthora fragariae]KAE9313434.1 hypothetical protein PF001_g8749 [Phytophthora fragariae]